LDRGKEKALKNNVEKPKKGKTNEKNHTGIECHRVGGQDGI
jgi:hypothetical protein